MQPNVDTMHHHHFCHAVCWKSILAGAVTAAVVSLILLALGSGIGLAALSPFGGDTETITSFTVKMAIWMIIMQWLSAGIGGYLAGRLRKKHDSVHNDEAFFRDTAHGFLTWAVATLITAALLTGAVGSLVSGGAKAATTVTAAAAAGAGKEAMARKDDMKGPGAMPFAYDIDTMFRTATPNNAAPVGESNMEAARIIGNDIKLESFPDADKQYLTQMVVARTGVTQEEASARVNDMVTKVTAAKQAAMETAEKARKASSAFSIFTAISMLLGAFIAGVAAAVGGNHRNYLYNT